MPSAMLIVSFFDSLFVLAFCVGVFNPRIELVCGLCSCYLCSCDCMCMDFLFSPMCHRVCWHIGCILHAPMCHRGCWHIGCEGLPPNHQCAIERACTAAAGTDGCGWGGILLSLFRATEVRNCMCV